MHPRVNVLSSVAWQYRSAIRSWAPTACGQTLHVASSTRYAVPRSPPSLSLVWGVTSPAREAAPDSDALPRRPAAGRVVLGLLIGDRRPRLVGVVHAGRVQRWALAGSGVLREGHDRRRPDHGEHHWSDSWSSRRVDCSDLRRTCSTEIPPEPARSRQPSNIPMFSYQLIKLPGGGSCLLAVGAMLQSREASPTISLSAPWPHRIGPHQARRRGC